MAGIVALVLVAHETYPLVANVYSSNDIVTLLASVRFTEVGVPGGYQGRAPTELDGFHVLITATTGRV